MLLAPELTLLEAVKAGDAKTVRSLLARKVDVNKPESDGTTALHWAVENDDFDLTSRATSSGCKGASRRIGME
jgi:ankyrin repeat protein